MVHDDGVVQSSGKAFEHLVERRLVEFQANGPLQFAANARFGRQFAIQVGIDQQAAVGHAIGKQQIGRRIDLRVQHSIGRVRRGDDECVGILLKNQAALMQQELRRTAQ